MTFSAKDSCRHERNPVSARHVIGGRKTGAAVSRVHSVSGPATPATVPVATSVILAGTLLAVAFMYALSNADAARPIRASKSTLLDAVGNAPSFCREQTWPNIDARCLKRTETSVPAVTPPGRSARHVDDMTEGAATAGAPIGTLSPPPGSVPSSIDFEPALSPSAPAILPPTTTPEPNRRQRHRRGFSTRAFDRHAVY